MARGFAIPARWVIAGALVVVGSAAHADGSASTDKIEKAREATLDSQYQADLPGTEASNIDLGSGAFPNGGIDRSGNHNGDGRDVRWPEHGSGGSAEGSDGLRGGDPRDRYRRDSRARDGRYDRRPRDSRYDDDEYGNGGGPMSGLFKFLLWGIVIIGIALIIFWIASELLGYGGSNAELAPNPEDEAGGSKIDMAVIERPLGDAEELAARGEYTEAIHTLLLRTLQELVRSTSVRVSPAMTSREILARVPLLADSREALAGLISAVEMTHFRGTAATLEDYVFCRDQFHKFATAFRAGGVQARSPYEPQGTGTYAS
ncbi:MAG: hypothetical protein QM831_23730 [Kofleriaceae bacterium]